MNLERVYEYRLGGTSQEARRGVWKSIAEYVYERMGRPQRMLDPAAGRGEFINQIPAEERWAVDPMESSRAYMNPEVRFEKGDFLEADLPAGFFDGAFLSNVLEHLSSPEEVARFLGKVNRLLTPGGRIAIMGPNFRYCSKEYFDCADHKLTLTHHSVAEQLYGADFEPMQIVPRFIPYSFKGRLPASPALTSLYLKTPIAWPLFGKQFLLIARKSARLPA